MYLNKIVIIVMVIGIMGLALIFMFDPTHDYPTVQVEVELLPGEETTIRVPTTTSGFLKWAGALIRNPYLWIETNVDGLELVDYIRDIVPGVQFGFPPNDSRTESGEMVVRNNQNDTVIAVIDCVMAPSPSDLGSSKTWWYIVYGILEVVIAGIIAVIKPTANVIVRSPAASGLAARTGAVEQTGKVDKARSILARILTMFCLRKAGTGGDGIEMT